ncbi:hypothetical protein CN613_25710 [Bacillus pseudomycoides]|uniref:Tail spike domain-containing protein n=1 Tax=Bacillus pseudomycoides TaxID=64104 RepID=A0A2A8BYI3_9BACI|nr:phage tail spike protein [Bacillus pseudomycoides]PEM65342.1 hypothetical protein CN613_25710 [Bacillus pseudomycoides]
MLFILDNYQQVIGVVSNDSPKTLPYFDDVLHESIETGVVTFEFSVPATHEKSRVIRPNHYVVVRDLDYNFLLFTIKEVEEYHEGGQMLKHVFCENTAVSELLSIVIPPTTYTSVSFKDALTRLMANTNEWEIAEPDSLPWITESKTIEFKEYTNLLDALHVLVGEFEFEIFFTVELYNLRVIKKKVHIVQKRGHETGVRFEYGRNLTDVRRKEDSTGVVTALYGISKKNYYYDHSKRIDLSMHPAYKGTDFYKPADVPWIGSQVALDRWGRRGVHVFGIYTSDTADTPEQLFKETYAELERRTMPYLVYEASIQVLERVTNYSGQKVRVGDRIVIADKTFTPEIVLSARVIELNRSMTDPTKDSVKLGEYRRIPKTISKILAQLQDFVLGYEGQITGAVTGEDLPVISETIKGEVSDKIVEEHIRPINSEVSSILDQVVKADEKIKEIDTKVVDIDGIMNDFKDDLTSTNQAIEEREVKIYKQPAPPTGVPIDTLWVNTGEKPISYMRRWDGTDWNKLAPSNPLEIGAASGEELSNLQTTVTETQDSFTRSITSLDTKINGMSVGGRNRIRNSTFEDGMKYFTTTTNVSVDKTVTFRGYSTLKSNQSGETTNKYRGLEQKNIAFSVGKQYVASFYLMTDDYTTFDNNMFIEIIAEDANGVRTFPVTPKLEINFSKVGNGNWQRFSLVCDAIPENTATLRVCCRVWQNGRAWIALPQVEEGNIPTDHTVAPEDNVSTVTYTTKVSELDQSLNGLTSRVSSTEVNVTDTTARITSAETFISQNKDNITLLAKSDGVGSMLNQSPTGFKIAGRLLDISGLVTFSTFDAATQAKINAIDTTAGAANSTANSVKSKTDAWTSNSTYINGGKIYTGTITASQLNVNDIFANAAVIGKIQTYNLSADRITAGTIKGIKYESINASDPNIKLVLETNSLKTYGVIKDGLQDYTELKEGKLYMYRYTAGQVPTGSEVKSEISPEHFWIWNKIYWSEVNSIGLVLNNMATHQQITVGGDYDSKLNNYALQIQNTGGETMMAFPSDPAQKWVHVRKHLWLDGKSIQANSYNFNWSADAPESREGTIWYGQGASGWGWYFQHTNGWIKSIDDAGTTG